MMPPVAGEATCPRAGSLSVEEVCDLLVAMELPQHVASFRECSIDGGMVEHLDELWEELGVRLQAHCIKNRRRLCRAVFVRDGRPAGLGEPGRDGGGAGADGCGGGRTRASRGEEVGGVGIGIGK